MTQITEGPLTRAAFTELLNSTTPCTEAGHSHCTWTDDGGDISRFHTAVDPRSGIELARWEYPTGDPRNDDTEMTRIGVSLPQHNDSDYAIAEAVKLHADLGRVLQTLGATPPLASWLMPTWATDGQADTGCFYNERLASTKDTKVWLTQTDQLEFHEDGGDLAMVRQPAYIHIPHRGTDDEVLSVEVARAMVTGPEVADDPTIAAIVELLTAFDEATS